MIKRKKNPTNKAKAFAESIVGEKVEFLGEGQQGEVYSFGNKVIKMFHRKLQLNCLKYFVKLSSLKLIPQIYEISPDFMIQELVKGKTLEKVLNGKLEYNDGLDILASINQLVRDWHSLNCAHGDLENFENIIVTKKGVVFIDLICYGYDEQYKENDLDALEFIRNEIWELAK